MAKQYKYFILTGEPGVGKTTLIKKLCSGITQNGVKTSGFYTEEVRSGRVREGFDVVTLDGLRARLARDESLLNTPVKYRVGKYGVLVQEFEEVALPSIIQPNTTKQLLVIDEIGKMEFFSMQFKNKIKDIFSNSSCIVLATIPVRKSDQLIESIRNNSLAKVWMVTRENRNSIYESIIKEISNVFN